jgi:hypothetical protein
MCACVQDARIDKKRLADIALLQSSTIAVRCHFVPRHVLMGEG